MNDHHDKNTLLLFMYEELPGDELHAVQQHVDTCKICRRELTLLQETLNIYQALPEDVPPQEILSKILTRRRAPTPEKSLLTGFDFLSSIQQRRWTIVSLCGILLVGSMVLLITQPWKRPVLPETRESVIFISQWRPPTDFLLKSPGDTLLKTVPRLGSGLAEINVTISHTQN